MTRARLKLNTGQLRARQRAGAVKGLKLAAEHLLQVSRTLVPIEEGTLERSGTVSVDEGALKAAVSYSTPYAVRQHEELTWKHDEGRQAKYLEQPLTNEAQTMLALVAAQIRRSLR
ncbi:minor capsid protein [Nonomuraea sp. MTCD27]|uniref:minor capsid protein n=1 Tax=Nonomuraea sp. MTCD27 TaxID=1676747 RepID=UPI0035C1C647